MASHYDRPPAPYATRHSPMAGSSRADPFYERDLRVAFPPPEGEYLENERISPRRDDRTYYSPQEYIAPPRDSRVDPWARDDPWYSRPPFSRRPSPSPQPLPQPQTPIYNSQFSEFRAPSTPHWEEHHRWDTAPESRGFEPSVAWRHTHREPPNARINSLLDPIPPSPEADDRRWREPDLSPVYGRTYPLEYPAYDYRQPAYYDRPAYPESDLYRPRHPYDDRPPSHWASSAYRPGPQPALQPAPVRPNRPSAIRDYKRPRQVSLGQSPRPSDSSTPHWNRDKGGDSSRNSREGSLSSPAPQGLNDRERTITGSSQMGARSILAPSNSASPATKSSRPGWDAYDDNVFTGDGRAREVVRPTQGPKLVPDNFAGPSEFPRQNIQASISSGQLSMSNSFQSASQSKPMSSPLKRQEWSSSRDESNPLGNNNIWSASPRIIYEPTARPSLVSDFRPVESSRRFSPVRYDSASSWPVKKPSVKSEDVQPPSVTESPNVRPQGSLFGRQSVMSVHNLVSHSPAKVYAPVVVPQKPLTPLLPDNNDMDVDNPHIQQSNLHSDVVQTPAALEDQPHITEVGNLAPEHSLSSLVASAGMREPDHWASFSVEPSVEPSVVGISRTATPNDQTPDLDADAALAEVEVQVDKVTLSSPKLSPVPSILLVQQISQNQEGTMRIMPPRPKADEKAITGTLRKAIMARRCLSCQTREQRVNPILMDNLAKADEPQMRPATAPELLIEEVLQRIFSQNEEEHHMNARSVLAASFAGQRELLAEKTQKLRNEYMTLHEQWVAHCAQLDSLFKANDMTETAALTGRTTRRSAATLGDAVRSDLEMEQIIASLGNEDLTDPNHLAVRNVATIPDMISVEKGNVEYLFDDTNNLVDDPETFYDPRSGFFDWTPEEEAIFYRKYAESPKQFGIISAFLPHKTASQCVLYYYIHKKKLVDFRNAANSGNGKRRKGVRKGGKQKGNALLADVAQADSKRPAGRGRRRGRGGGPIESGRGRGAGIQPAEMTIDQDPRPKRRRVATTPKIVMAKEMDVEDVLSVDTDQTREASVIPPKKRRGRKPKYLTESPAASPLPSETKFIDVNESLGRRKSTTSSSNWNEADRDEFIRLLSRHGKDFKRIASSMPNKTTIQVTNYYKSHLKEWNLEKIAAGAPSRSPSPEQNRFVSVSRIEASQTQTPTEEKFVDALFKDADDRQVADATSGIGVLSLDQNEHAFSRSSSNFHAMTNNSFVSVLSPGAYQAAGASNPHGMLIPPNGTAVYSYGIGRKAPIPSQDTTNQVAPTGQTTSTSQAASTFQPVSHLPRYAAFSPQMPMTFSVPRPGVLPFVPASASGLFAPAGGQLNQAPLRPGEYQSGLPLHMLPPGHPGLQQAQPPPDDFSKERE